jgi:hypothetical protein
MLRHPTRLVANFLPMDYAILIGGGFAKRKLGSAKKPVAAGDFKDLIDRIGALPALRECRLHRVYYYDSWPLKSSEANLCWAER